MNSLSKNTFFNILYNLANLIFPMISSMYVSRILLVDGVGKVAYAQNITSYFIMLACLGISVYGTREIAIVRKNKREANKLFTELLVINAVTTLFSAAVFFIVINQVPRFRSDYALMLCCGIQVILNLFNIDWLYQGYEEYAYISCRSIIVKTCSLIAVFIFVKNRNDYVCYALISSLALSTNYLFNIIHSKSFVSLSFHNLNLKKHIKPLMVLAFSVFFTTAYSKIDITMLGIMKSDAVVGIYSNSQKINDIIITLTASISSVFLPRFSYYYTNDRNEFDRLLTFGMKILGFIAFPMFIGVYLLAPYGILAMYGDSFACGAITLRILSLLIIIKSFANLICYQMVISTGQEKKLLYACIIASLINIVLNFILIPSYDQNGAAVASVISEFSVDFIQLLLLRKTINFVVPIKEFWKNILSTSIMAIVINITVNIINNVISKLLFSFIFGCLTYGIVSYLFKVDIFLELIKKVKEKLFIH